MEDQGAPEERWPVGELGRCVLFCLEPYLGVLVHRYDLILIDVVLVRVPPSPINEEGLIRRVPEREIIPLTRFPIPSLSSEGQHAGRKESLKHLVYFL